MENQTQKQPRQEPNLPHPRSLESRQNGSQQEKDRYYVSNAYDPEDAGRYGVEFDLRANIALNLITHWGMGMHKRTGETKSGHVEYDILPAEEVVDRAMAISEAAVTKMEARGWVRESTVTPEQAAWNAGRVKQITDQNMSEADLDRFLKQSQQQQGAGQKTPAAVG